MNFYLEIETHFIFGTCLNEMMGMGGGANHQLMGWA